MIFYGKNALKVDFPTDKYLFSISLSHNFPVNKMTKLPYRHIHARYEVLCAYQTDAMERSHFLLEPPLHQHLTYYEEGENWYVTTFQFSVEERKPAEESEAGDLNRILERFLYIEEETKILDTFEARSG